MLFERTNRGLLLTQEGEALLREAGRLLDAAEMTREIVRQARNSYVNVLRLGCHGNLLRHALPTALGLFRKKNPQTRVLVSDGMYQNLLAELRNGDIDGVITLFHPEFNGIGWTEMGELCEETIYAVLPCDSPLANMEALTMNDLAGIPQNLFNGEDKKQLVRDMQDEGLKTSVYAYTESQHCIETMVAAGYGISMCVRSALREHPGIVYRRMLDRPPGSTVLMWRKAMVQTVVDKLVPRMLEYQSVSVDAVCGATATSNGVKQAVEAALIAAIEANGGDARDVRAFYNSIPQVSETEAIDTDVLVVGLGGAGMAAAISSAEQELNVLAIDKAAKWAGNAVLTSGPMAINVPSQVEAEIPEWTDPVAKEVITKKAGDDLIDKEALYQAWLEYTSNESGEQQAKPEMVRLFLDESGYTDDWLTQYGFQFDPASGFAGNSWAAYTPISGGKKLTEGFFTECMENFVKLGGTYMLETEAYDLIAEDGRITGAKAHSMVDGKEYVINAKAVALATGGYAGSGEMEEKYLENTYFPLKGEWKLFCQHQNDGKLLEAAIQNGAGTTISASPPWCMWAVWTASCPDLRPCPWRGRSATPPDVPPCGLRATCR